MKKYFRLQNYILLVINFIPLAGVLFFNWNALSLILYYFTETVMIGFIHLIKMTALYFLNHKNPAALAVVRTNQGLKGWSLLPFFVIHFGFFVLIQIVIFNGFVGHKAWREWAILINGEFRYALASLFVVKIFYLSVSLFWDHDLKLKLPEDVFFEPYPRIFIQQFMVLIGAWFSIFSGSMLPFLIVLILCKTLLDLAIANLDVTSLFTKIRLKSDRG